MNSPPLNACYRRLPQAVHSLLTALEERSPSTVAHARRVGAAAYRLAEFSRRMDQGTCEQIFLAGYLHDLGKLVVPMAILDKPAPLTPAEWEVVRMAAPCGESLLRPFFQPGEALVEAVRHEHERWDGGGYPDGLCGQQIPEWSRIVLIADTLDALRIHQAYRRASGASQALRVIAEGAGTQFDPQWVDYALRLWGQGLRASGPSPTPIPRLHSDRELSF